MLKEIGRHLLTQFSAHFQTDLAAKSISLPVPETPDEEYFKSLATLLKSPALLPESFKETLFDIEELARPDKSHFLKEAVDHVGQAGIIAEGVCHERVALQLWLVDPAVLVAVHSNQNHLTSFEGFAGITQKTDHLVPPPSPANLKELSARLNSWFRQRNPHAPNARVDLHVNRQGENWFVVRHGDTCRWIYNDEEGTAQLIHSAPESEDAILYLPEQVQLWISARTRAEVEFYRELFGSCLHGQPGHFSEPVTLTLEPLRVDELTAVELKSTAEIIKTIIRKTKTEWDTAFQNATTTTADDILAALTTGRNAITTGLAKGGKLSRAIFLLQFAGSPRGRLIKICLPNKIKLERPADLIPVVRWAVKNHLLIPAHP